MSANVDIKCDECAGNMIDEYCYCDSCWDKKNEEISNLNDEIGDLQTKVDDLEKQVAELEGK